jgi:hypothetical protein
MTARPPGQGSVLLVAETDTAGLTPGHFERWYLAERIPEVVTTGGHERGTLFVRLGPDGRGEILRLPGRYLAVYESGPAAPWQARHVRGVPALASASAIHVVMVNNTAPDRDDEFNAWYNDVHMGDVMTAGGYRAGIRYEHTAPAPGGARWLAVYEIDDPDPLQARGRVAAAAPRMPLWPHIEQVHVAVYARVRKGDG